MVLQFPGPPDPADLAARLDAGAPIAWTEWFHLAASRGGIERPDPVLWVDALRGAWPEEGPDAEREAFARRVLAEIAAAPPLPLETGWLRQTPREDASFVYTGSLAEVFAAASLEEAALRLSRVLRTVGSREYGEELVRDAAAWDLSDDSGRGLRFALAVTGAARWDAEDPAEREASRAVLLRWLSYLHPRRPALPVRPPRAPWKPFPIAPALDLLASAAARAHLAGESGAGSRGTGAGSRGTGAGSRGELRERLRLSAEAIVAVARAQEMVRVQGASFQAALASRWQGWVSAAEAPVAPDAPRTSPEARGEETGPEFLRRLEAIADLRWIRRHLSLATAGAIAPILGERP